MLSARSTLDRYYDPGTGQFLSLDPLVDLTGEPYGYVGGDPVNGTDPIGSARKPCRSSACKWLRISVEVNNAGNSSIDCLGSIGIIEQVWTPFIGTAFAPQLGTTLSQSSVVYHYATAEKAVRIAERGDIITPGYGGKIWVTPQRFKSAAEAEQKLGLPEKPTGYYEIPIERISSDVSAPSLVRALERTNGEVMEGGGIELITETPISVKGLDFQEFPEEP